MGRKKFNIKEKVKMREKRVVLVGDGRVWQEEGQLKGNKWGRKVRKREQEYSKIKVHTL